MICSKCPHWHKEDGCMANVVETELDLTCLAKHILWEMELQSGIMESDVEEDDDDADFWKKGLDS